jgi:cytochrome c oxidase assembly protein subunit 15
MVLRSFLGEGFCLPGSSQGFSASGARRLAGFVGWWMVKSGLSDRVSRQERLAIHLLLASLTFAALVWLAASLSAVPPKSRSGDCGDRSGCRRHGLARPFANRARRPRRWLARGHAFNTWPLIDGYFWPPLDKLTLLAALAEFHRQYFAGQFSAG